MPWRLPFVFAIVLALAGIGRAELGSGRAPSPDAALERRGAMLASAPSASGTWRWPVIGPVIRGFEQPSDPYSAGHRGIDIGAAFGTPVVAPAAGVVSFAGKVGGELFVTIDHGAGVTSTDSWVSAALVRKGDVVGQGDMVALSGAGHPGSTIPHLLSACGWTASTWIR